MPISKINKTKSIINVRVYFALGNFLILCLIIFSFVICNVTNRKLVTNQHYAKRTIITKQDFIHERFKIKHLTMHSKPSAYLNSSFRFKNLLDFFKVVFVVFDKRKYFLQICSASMCIFS